MIIKNVEVIAMKAIVIIAQKGFQDTEYEKTTEVLKKGGVQVTVASQTTDIATGKVKAKVTPDIAVSKASVKDYDAVVIIGGPGTDSLAADASVISLVKDARKMGKTVAAICIAPIILAKAGILQGRKATVFSTGRKEIEAGGAIYQLSDVVIDKGVITGSGSEASTKFGEAIVKALKGG